MKRPKLSSIDTLLSTGQDFSLTEKQYEKETSATMPKDFYYLRKKSAIAKLATSYGYKIVIQEKTIKFEKE